MLILLQFKILILISSIMDTLSQTTHLNDEQSNMEFMNLLDDSEKDFVSQGSDFVLSLRRNLTNNESLPALTSGQYFLLQTISALSTGHEELAEKFINKTLPRYNETSEEWLGNFRFDPYDMLGLVKMISNLNEENLTLKRLALYLSRKYDVLITAAEMGDDSLIIWLKLAGLDLSEIGGKAIASAWTMDRIDTVILLLEMDAIGNNSAREVTDVRNSKGETLLHLAAVRGATGLAKKLLDGGAIVDQKDAGSLTPLYHAVRSDEREMAELLLSRGADFFIISKGGNTLLHLAVMEDNFFAVARLLGLGLHIDAENDEGLTPLFLAAEAGFKYLMEFLIKRGAAVNIKTSSGNALLHVAVKRKSLNAVRNLVSHGASINSKNSEDLTPLYLAANVESPELIWFLLNKGAARQDSVSGFSLLHVAARRGDLQAIESLVNLCIPVDIVDKNGLTPLYTAASAGKLAAMKLLLFKGADLYITLNNGLRLLHAASVEGNVRAIESLLEIGIYVDVKDTDLLTALCRAVQKDNIVSVSLLIEKGANISFRTTVGDTLLHIAAAYNSSESIYHLVENGLYIEAENDQHETPLYIAVKKNNIKIANLLINLGANKNYVTSKGGTLAHLAASTNDFVAIRTLINIGVDFNLIDENGYTPLYTAIRKSGFITADFMLESGVDLFYIDPQYESLLHIAGRKKDHKAIDFLIDKGLYIDSQGWNGSRPIDVALYNGNCDTAEYFVKKGANVRGRNRMDQTILHSAVIGDCNSFLGRIADHIEIIDPKDQSMRTPLHLAAVLRRTDVADTLISLGADVNSLDNNNMTPFQIAAFSWNWKMVSSFLTEDANLNWTDVRGRTLLHLATDHSKEDIVRFLTEIMRFDVYMQDIYGRIPLHLAAEIGWHGIMRYLTDERFPGSIDYRDKEEKTALHLASISGYISTVEYLLEKGADPEAKDRYQQTPLIYAAKLHHWDIARLLMSRVCEVSHTNHTDEENRSILHLAVLDKEFYFISNYDRCLKKYINNKDSKGETPMDIALAMKTKEIVMYLFNHYKFELNLKDCFSLRLANAQVWDGVQILYKAEVSSRCHDVENRTLLHLVALHADESTLFHILEISTIGLDARDIDNRTPLHLAVIENRSSIVRILLEHGARKDIKDKDHMIPLDIAITNKNWDLVLQLLKNETDVRWTDIYNRTLLHYAAINARYEIIDYLLQNTIIDINAQDVNLNTPLQLAIAESNLSNGDRSNILGVFMNYGANLSLLDKRKRSILHLAAMHGCYEVVQELLILKKINIDLFDINEQTPLHLAARGNESDIVDLLLSNGANGYNADKENRTPLNLAVMSNSWEAVKTLVIRGYYKDDRYHGSRTLLHIAILNGLRDIAEYLINTEITELTATDDEGDSPLHIAARVNDFTTAQRLLNKGVKENALNGNGQSPLAVAAVSKSWDVVEGLIRDDCNVEGVYQKNRTLLHLAAMYGRKKIIDDLFSCRNVDINALDSNHETPLDLLIKSEMFYGYDNRTYINWRDGRGRTLRHQGLKMESFYQGFLIDAMDYRKQTPLHIASIKGGNYYQIKGLVDLGASINAVDINGHTPLHLAAMNGHINIMKHFISRPTLYRDYTRETYLRLNARDSLGRTPLQLSIDNGHTEITTLLKNDGAIV